ncbi:MAG TPA: sigma-70 family RNA polymerase sigma factor [Polyangiaceae bacterium]|nr:sigma-70 family RNA polymerase sigma factor [Polyangiaceae bacterium]
MHCEPAGELLVRRWLRDYVDYVARVLRSAGTPAQELDDAVQRTFIVAARRHADVRAGAERGFLLKTALHVAAHARRSAARRREVPTAELPEPINLETPEVLASAQREQRLFERLLARLVPELRTVLVLYEVEELTMAEIAATLSIPPGTVASRLRRARHELRQRWHDARGGAAALGGAVVLAASRAKAWAVVATLGLAAVVVVPRLRHPASTSRPATTLRSTAPSVVALTEAKTAAPAVVTETTAPPASPVAISLPVPAPSAQRAPARPATSSEALRLELQQLDKARALVAAGRGSAALVVLDGYGRAAPRGALRLEAEALRIDALAQSGRKDEARARAAAFLAKYPSSVLASRVRRLAGP